MTTDSAAVTSDPSAAWWRRPAVILVAVALALRVLYLSAYADALPFLRGPLGDSLVYLQQADDLRAGHLGSPALLAFSPLYGYLLAALGARGAAVLPVLLQFAMGAAVVALLFRIARDRFGAAAGVAAGALVLSYSTLVYYESKLLSETLGFLLAAGAMALYSDERFAAAKPRAALGAGALLALAVLARASLIFSLPLAVLAALPPWTADDPFARRLRRAALFAAGVALVLGANGLLNYAGSRQFVPVIMVSRTLESASGARFDGRLDRVSQGGAVPSPFDVVRQAERRLQHPEAEPAAQGGGGIASRLARLDLGAILAQAPHKIAQTFTNREMTYQYGFVGERDAVPFLRVMPGSFGAFALLALAGAYWLARERGARALWAYAPLFVGCIVTCVMYHPSSRYRLAMVLPMFVLGALGVARTFAPSPSDARKVAMGVLAVGVLGFAVHWQTLSLRNRVEWELQLAGSCLNARDRECALEHGMKAVEAAHGDPGVRARAAVFGVPQAANMGR